MLLFIILNQSYAKKQSILHRHHPPHPIHQYNPTIVTYLHTYTKSQHQQLDKQNLTVACSDENQRVSDQICTWTKNERTEYFCIPPQQYAIFPTLPNVDQEMPYIGSSVLTGTKFHTRSVVTAPAIKHVNWKVTNRKSFIHFIKPTTDRSNMCIHTTHTHTYHVCFFVTFPVGL